MGNDPTEPDERGMTIDRRVEWPPPWRPRFRRCATDGEVRHMVTQLREMGYEEDIVAHWKISLDLGPTP